MDTMALVLFLHYFSCSVGLRKCNACHFCILAYRVASSVSSGDICPIALSAGLLILVLFSPCASGSIGCVAALRVILFCTLA